MFKKQVQSLADLLPQVLRETGLETPLQQHRAVEAWDKVVGVNAARYTRQKYIKNQMLFVSVSHPALRQMLSMQRQDLVQRINQVVGANVIVDVVVR